MLVATPTATPCSRLNSGPEEGSDHLFLLPERALSMDTTQLREDLASLDFSVSHHSIRDADHMNSFARPSLAGRGNVWISGAAPASVPGSHHHHQQQQQQLQPGEQGAGGDAARPPEPPQRSSSAHRAKAAARDAAAAAAAQKEREERIKALKERQGEERQRKLEELKQQALAAQRFREQKEEERRRRIEELRQRDQERRSQVEERKRALWEAEREKREQLIRKTQEREARLEAKRRNERSSIVFAFGSSTPRMLEPADTGGSFWGTRRATSTTNVMFSGTPLTRRSSERELDIGSVSRKQRATSAHALDRKPGEGDEDMEDGTQSHLSSRARKKTDLMPTIPSSSRESSGTRSRHRSPGSVRGDITPATASSRPQSAMSQQSERSQSGSVQLRPRPPTRKPRPSSIAVTGVGVVNDAAKARTPAATPDNKEREKSASSAPTPRQRKGSNPNVNTGKLDVKKALSARKDKPTPKTTPLVSPASETPPPIQAKEELVDLDQPEKQDAMKPEESPATPTQPLL